MNSVVPMQRRGAAVSLSRAQQLEGHGLPTSLAYSLPASVADALSFRRVTPEYQTEPLPGLQCVVVDVGEVASADDLALAHAMARDAVNEQGNPADSLLATARLRAVARQRPTITADEKMALAVYAEKLAKYPAEVVAMACEKWLESSPFWPSVAELLKACEWAAQPRRALALALFCKLPEETRRRMREARQ
jgi:hypothetical protein